MKKLFLGLLFCFLTLAMFLPRISAAEEFNPTELFPSWEDEGHQVVGILGKNEGDLNTGESRLLLYFIPNLTTILMKLVAPIVMVMFFYSGIRFIYAGDNEEQVKESKEFFQYGIMGIAFIVLSFSFMKAVYFIIGDVPGTEQPSITSEASISAPTILVELPINRVRL
ncbi:hypothetical protein KAI58_01165 [Candidatus Gracilibacteria bacterium]|nr:hypothetical protein [Candidatus Gracilibacteria bacterium]